MGPVLNYGKYYYATKYGEDAYRKTEFELFHWFGDPTMQIWTDVPQTLTVSYSSALSPGATSIDVTVNQADAVICVSKNGAILSRKLSVSGITKLSWSAPLVQGDVIYITVTKHNFRPYEGSACSYSISPSSKSFTSYAGAGSVNVTTSSGCSWTAVSNATSWITITSGASGNGNGSVNYSVAANTDTGSRTGTLTIAGQTFTVTQAGCTYSINPTSNSVVSAGGSGSVNVTAASGCNWTAISNDNWISISSGSTGSGNGTVAYSVLANPNTSSRNGTLIIAEQIFRVTQNGTADFSNSLGMTFNLIPAGTFVMGSPLTEPGRENWNIGHNYEVQHQVTLTKSFYMMTTEVTQKQWKDMMGNNPSLGAGSYDCDNCPVDQVSWSDAQAFIVRMNQRGEGTYRLPTEAEWEYSARAGSTTGIANGELTNIGYVNNQYCCTPIDNNLDAIGWYCGNSDGTHPVGQKQANAWGLYDMHGNVSEWVQDWWGISYQSCNRSYGSCEWLVPGYTRRELVRYSAELSVGSSQRR